MTRAIRNFLILALFVAGTLVLARFLIENYEPMQLDLLGWRTKETSKGVLVVLAFAVGVLSAGILIFSAAFSKSLEASRLKRENRSLQRLLENQVRETTPQASPQSPAPSD